MKQSNQAISLSWQISMRLTLLVIALGALVRTVMICKTGPSALDLSFGQYCGAYLIGALNDLAFAVLSLVFIWLFTVSVGNGKYKSPAGYIILGLLVAATIYLTWFCPTLQDFNRGLAKAMRWIMLYWTLSFAGRLFIPGMRKTWTAIWLTVILFLYVGVMFFNAVGEYFFWDEFAVRYNFIAVDYLVYTSEVIGNIMESYPIIPLASLMVVISGVTTWWLFRRQIKGSTALYGNRWRMRASIIYIASAAVALWFLTFSERFQKSDNVYYNELQANGAYRFFDAFMKNKIEYNQFYTTIPENEAESIVRDIYKSTGRNERYVKGDSIERHPNIVLITMESMSASFMERFGNTSGITPNLDSLYNISVSFDRMFANGNRTVRGLEALSLAIPPSAGQSLIKRPGLKDRPSIGGVLREKGYHTMFFYGGKSYFDNMGPFFRSIGFDVIDKDNYSPEEITFSNIWGVCDEDSYAKMLSTLDKEAATGVPFYAQMMTISNHRPYTYPEGRIDIPADSKSREGGVKYSDYALGRFMREASKKPWFDNTIFVIVADHCASSAGETELPLGNYHIPAIIYAPKLFSPRTVDYTVSQIDLMPTVLSMAGIGYKSTFYGRNAFAENYNPRAFLATYQDLGYFDGKTLTVLSPVRRVRQYTLKPTKENPLNTEKTASADSVAIKQAVALYQTSSIWND